MIKVVHQVTLSLTGDSLFQQRGDVIHKVVGERAGRSLTLAGVHEMYYEVSFYDLPPNIQEAWKEACR